MAEKNAPKNILHPVCQAVLADLVLVKNEWQMPEAKLKAWAEKLKKQHGKDKDLFVHLAYSGLEFAKKNQKLAGLHLCALAGVGLGETVGIEQLASGDKVTGENAAAAAIKQTMKRNPVAGGGLHQSTAGAGLRGKKPKK